jgi:hypothetical protein
MGRMIAERREDEADHHETMTRLTGQPEPSALPRLAPLARCLPLLVPYDVAPGMEFQAGHRGKRQLVFISGGDRFATTAAGHMRRGADPELRRRRSRELLVLQQLPYALPHQLVDRDGSSLRRARARNATRSRPGRAGGAWSRVTALAERRPADCLRRPGWPGTGRRARLDMDPAPRMRETS